MNFARSLSSPSLKCTLEERQQMNQISHWLDASSIYGSSIHEAAPLREKFGGRLKVSAQVGSRRGMLPVCEKELNKRKIAMCSKCKHCFSAGDVRANEQRNLIGNSLHDGSVH